MAAGRGGWPRAPQMSPGEAERGAGGKGRGTLVWCPNSDVSGGGRQHSCSAPTQTNRENAEGNCTTSRTSMLDRYWGTEVQPWHQPVSQGLMRPVSRLVTPVVTHKSALSWNACGDCCHSNCTGKLWRLERVGAWLGGGELSQPGWSIVSQLGCGSACCGFGSSCM